MVKVYFKNGKILEGILTYESDTAIKVDSVGLPLSYFKDEINKIERVKH
jgi:hypothetical protein